MGDQSVIIAFYGFAEKFWTEDHEPLDPLHELEGDLVAALDGKGVGELDGHEIAMDGSDGTLFLYGADADALFAVIEPVLKSSTVTQGGHATLRYGPATRPNVMEKYVAITPHVN
jgi:hypothetical protein